MLPSPYQSDDSNRTTFGFFALSSLAILGALDRLGLAERADYIDWIYRRWNHKIGGFGGALNIDLRGLGPDEEPCDHPHLAHTYTALLILALLKLTSNERPEPESPYGALDLPKLLQFVQNHEDVRFVYCAIAILAMIRVDPGKVIDVNSTERFLKSCRRYEGGYGQAPYCEAQGGTTYCALASLALLGRLESSQTEEEADQTVRWLVDRQGELVDSPGISPERDNEDAATKLRRTDAQQPSQRCCSYPASRRETSGQANSMLSQQKPGKVESINDLSLGLLDPTDLLTTKKDSGSIDQASDEAGPSTDIDTDLLLRELRSLQENLGRDTKSSIHRRVKHQWEQWNEFLKTPQGKTLDPNIVHDITHEFLFLHPSKLLTIFEETEQQHQNQSVSSSPPKIFRSIGFATLRYQNWTVLKRLLSRQKDLTRRSDVLSIIRIATRKILFSTTLKTQTSRIQKIIELCETITDTFNENTDCKKCMSQSVEIFCDALLRMSCHEYASNMVLQIIRQHPTFTSSFDSRFLHRLMSTCASHQSLSIAHDLLAEIPSELQTWINSRLVSSHPHLLPDLDAYNLYLSLKSKLGHVDELFKIIQNMERRQILVDDHYNNDNNQRQTTYGILLHSIGRRRGLKSAYQILPELISKGYIPDKYTSNILLSAFQKGNNDTTTHHHHPVPPCRNQLSVVQAREERLLQTMEEIKKGNMKSDEVTRNILVRSFLSRSPHHSKEEILNIKRISLNHQSEPTDIPASNLDLDRKQFRRFRKPLYSMLSNAYQRANCIHEFNQLKIEWKSQSRKSKSNSNIKSKSVLQANLKS
ncbi:hypothetical protein MJO28_017403 [Puccinia striiformis f. sp. tritici]|nr:hypothetical protein MJO28_017403 [Puccinia striiformis f. sp. tritici]